MKAKTYLFISGLIFGVVCLGHLLRIVFSWPLVIGALDVPMAVSWMGMIITAGLVVWVIAMLTREKSG
ncbi:MAG: hypothetical protein KAH56_13520 [Candidatus Krumholzibacteria bacterium]|nr:hypothetical protein [Candidatus Krumholzibacteria bacterium]